MPEQKEAVPIQPQRLADLLHLLHEARQLPQVGLVRLVAIEGAELVVVVVLDPRRGQIAVEGLEALVGCARSTVQQQQPHRRRVADALRPDPKRALRRIDRDQPDTTAQDVVAAGIVEIARRAQSTGGHCLLLAGMNLARRSITSPLQG